MKYIRSPKPSWLNEGLRRSNYPAALIIFGSVALMVLYMAAVASYLN